MSQFQTTIVSANSKYDKVQQGFETYSPQEKNGYLLYQQNCSSCHVEPLFSSYEFANNGLPIDTFFNDYGVGAITMNSSDSLKFKIPSLRNLSYTYPYMHDGRFNKLKEVIDHYLGLNPNDKGLDNRLSKQIELTDNEQIDLIVFLLTLNDKDFVFEPKFQYPKQILRSTEGN